MSRYVMRQQFYRCFVICENRIIARKLLLLISHLVIKDRLHLGNITYQWCGTAGANQEIACYATLR